MKADICWGHLPAVQWSRSSVNIAVSITHLLPPFSFICHCLVHLNPEAGMLSKWHHWQMQRLFIAFIFPWWSPAAFSSCRHLWPLQTELWNKILSHISVSFGLKNRVFLSIWKYWAWIFDILKLYNGRIYFFMNLFVKQSMYLTSHANMCVDLECCEYEEKHQII